LKCRGFGIDLHTKVSFDLPWTCRWNDLS
jgi:hypothetical protein